MMSASFLILFIFHFIKDRTEASTKMLIGGTLETMLYSLVWVLGRRFKKLNAYGLVLLFTATQLHTLYSYDVNEDIRNDEIHEAMLLRSRYEYMMRTATFFAVFATPSMFFMGIYSLIYVGAIAWLSFHHGDLSKPQFIETISQQPVYVLACFIVFYIL